MMSFLLRIAIIIITSCSGISKETPIANSSSKIINQPTLLYGIPIDSFEIEKGKIKWNQTLSEMLNDFSILDKTIYEIAKKSKKVYDVRKIKVDKPYTIIYEKDSLKKIRQFIFEPDNRSYVIYHFADSLYVEHIKRNIKIVKKAIQANIESSVYEAAIGAGGSQVLVNRLVDILAWQVDFFRIEKGDHFKVIFEEEQVDGQAIGIRNVLGVYFKHRNKSYYGILYSKEEKKDYFDENGNSLRKTFLRAPLSYKRISSRYSLRRYHPVQRRYKAHLGTDYAANPGTPIRTVGDGIILAATYGKYNGNYVKIKHNSNYTTQYLHMKKIKSGIRQGIKVKQGQIIGFVGSTGLANGPHLCYRFWKNGRQVDAFTVNLPPSEPIDPSQKIAFLHQKNIMIHQLDLMN